MMKHTFIIVSTLIPMLHCTGCRTTLNHRQPVRLGALQEWQIFVADDAEPSEQYAAKELQQLIEKAAGHVLPIRSVEKSGDVGSDTSGRILVGPGAAATATVCNTNNDQLGSETLRIIAKDQEIVITGGSPRGTLYGVYTFCERALGIRFLTADHTHIPPLATDEKYGPVDFSYSPPIVLRRTYCTEFHLAPDFAVRLRQNAQTDKPELGGRTTRRVFNHTMGRLLPWKQYGREHPEYYCLRDGKRPTQSGRIQPCFSNTEARQIMISNLLRLIERGYPKQKAYSVSQADNDNFCECTLCAAKDAVPGSHDGQLLEFVNYAAEEVEKHYPDITIGTLIYRATRHPVASVRPRHNVTLQLCSIECCQVHRLNDPTCPLNRPFQQDLTNWRAKTDSIAVWHYNVNFSNYHVPCPNLFNLDDNVRYFVEQGIDSIFMQCVSVTPGAEFSDLRNYVIAQLLWDPSQDGDALIAEFLDLHYGAAAPPIRRFINRIHSAAQASGQHGHCYAMAQHYGLHPEHGFAGMQDFEEALALAPNETVRKRVEKLSLCAWRLAAEMYVEALFTGRSLSSLELDELRPVVKTFFELCKTHEVSWLSEDLQTKDAGPVVADMLGLPVERAMLATPGLLPLADAFQHLLALYQGPKQAFTLTVGLDWGKEQTARVRLLRTESGSFRLEVSFDGTDVVLQHAPDVFFLHLPAQQRLYRGVGEIPAETSTWGLSPIIQAFSDGDPRIGAAANIAKGLSGAATLLIPGAVGIKIAPGSVVDGEQYFALRFGGHVRARFRVDLTTNMLTGVEYEGPNHKVRANVDLQLQAMMPAPPMGGENTTTLPRVLLEPLVLNSAILLLKSRVVKQSDSTDTFSAGLSALLSMLTTNSKKR